MDQQCWKLAYHVALVSAHLGKYVEALKYSQKSIDLFPGYAGAWYLTVSLLTADSVVENMTEETNSMDHGPSAPRNEEEFKQSSIGNDQNRNSRRKSSSALETFDHGIVADPLNAAIESLWELPESFSLQLMLIQLTSHLCSGTCRLTTVPSAYEA